LVKLIPAAEESSNVNVAAVEAPLAVIACVSDRLTFPAVLAVKFGVARAKLPMTPAPVALNITDEPVIVPPPAMPPDPALRVMVPPVTALTLRLIPALAAVLDRVMAPLAFSAVVVVRLPFGQTTLRLLNVEAEARLRVAEPLLITEAEPVVFRAKLGVEIVIGTLPPIAPDPDVRVTDVDPARAPLVVCCMVPAPSAAIVIVEAVMTLLPMDNDPALPDLEVKLTAFVAFMEVETDIDESFETVRLVKVAPPEDKLNGEPIVLVMLTAPVVLKIRPFVCVGKLMLPEPDVAETDVVPCTEPVEIVIAPVPFATRATVLPLRLPPLMLIPPLFP